MVERSGEWLSAPAARALDGGEAFEGVSATVSDFWRFALGDLRVNNARGYLAEFLVARALGLDAAARVEWDAYDLLFGDVRVEVKSSAYLQAWEQRQLSRITFSGLKATPVVPRRGYDPAGKQFNADVYVFCLQTATDHGRYDVLEVQQWAFFVLPRAVLVERDVGSIALTTLESLTGRVTFAQLRAEIERAAEPSRPTPPTGS